MVKFRFIIGVQEGYGHENKNMTPAQAVSLGTSVATTAMSDRITKLEGKSVEPLAVKNLEVRLARSIYNKNYGCPSDGELCVLVEGECEEAALPSLKQRVIYMMHTLGQYACTIEKEIDGKNAGCTDIFDKGDSSAEREPSERFLVRFNSNDLEGIAESLVADLTNTPEGSYQISGGLIHRDGHVEYIGTQNERYQQTDPEKYKTDLVKLIERLGKGALIEVSDAQIFVKNSHTLQGVKKAVDAQKAKNQKE